MVTPYVLSPLGRKLETVANRSLFLRVHPRPSNLGERRAVLRAIQKYGDVEVFKKLAEDSSFMTVVASASIAQKLLQRSPIHFEFITERFDAMKSQLLTRSKTSNITEPIEPIEISERGDGQHASDKEGLLRKNFELHIFPTKNHQHQTIIRSSPLHGPWPSVIADKKESFVYSALKAVVPKGMGAEGLCDWRTGQVAEEIIMPGLSSRADTEEGRHSESRKTAIKMWHIENRKRRQGQRTKTPLSMAQSASSTSMETDRES